MIITLGWCREPHTRSILAPLADADQMIKQANQPPPPRPTNTHTHTATQSDLSPSSSQDNNIYIYESVHKGEHRSPSISRNTAAPV